MNTQENNKLIAEFMGYRFDEDGQLLKDEYGFWVDAQFDSSWNQLIPVIAKINLRDYTYKGEVLQDTVNTNLLDGDINRTYYDVIEFIKWYNNNKTRTP